MTQGQQSAFDPFEVAAHLATECGGLRARHGDRLACIRRARHFCLVCRNLHPDQPAQAAGFEACRGIVGIEALNGAREAGLDRGAVANGANRLGLDRFRPVEATAGRIHGCHGRPTCGRALRSRRQPCIQGLLLRRDSTPTRPNLTPWVAETRSAMRGASSWQTSTPADGPPSAMAAPSVRRSSPENAFAASAARVLFVVDGAGDGDCEMANPDATAIATASMCRRVARLIAHPPSASPRAAKRSCRPSR